MREREGKTLGKRERKRQRGPFPPSLRQRERR